MFHNLPVQLQDYLKYSGLMQQFSKCLIHNIAPFARQFAINPVDNMGSVHTVYLGRVP